MPHTLTINVMPFGHWPEHDQRAWSVALQQGGHFDEGGGLARYKSERQQVMRAAYGRWLGFLHESLGTEVPLSGLDLLHDRDLLTAYMSRLHVLASNSARAYVTDLATVGRAMAPDVGFTLIAAAARHLWKTARPQADKIGRIVPARDLYGLGFNLMESASDAATPLKCASRYRDGLMIAILAAAPVRIGNFVAIEIGRHLVCDGVGYRLCFSSGEVKNRRPLELKLPPALAPAINLWISAYRPECLSRRGRWRRQFNESALWISESGSRYVSASQVGSRIQRQALRRFGKRINPHLFRDIAATSIATELPAQAGIIRSVLGHAGLKTGERFYNQARSVAAAATYHAALDMFHTPRSALLLAQSEEAR